MLIRPGTPRSDSPDEPMTEKLSSDEQGPLAERSNVAGEATSAVVNVIGRPRFFAYVWAVLIGGLRLS